MNRDLVIPAFIGLIMIATFYWVSSFINSVLIFIPGVIISYIFYVKTSYRKLPHPNKSLVYYLAALAIQFLHFSEEFLTDFISKVPELLGTDAYSLDAWVLFNMIAYAVFILGGIIIYRGIKSLMIVPIFFVIVGVFLNSIGHILLSIYSGGYFPGLYTAVLYLAIIPFILKAFKT
jgi:hypothetical protein